MFLKEADVYSSKILADSADGRGNRLVTFEVTFPRLVLAEFNTHCMLARNSASSRAIPVAKQIKRIMEEPFVPERFGVNQPGMQNEAWLEGDKAKEARAAWLTGRDRAVVTALELLLGNERVYDSRLAVDPDFEDPEERQYVLEQLDEFQAAIKTSAEDYLNVHKQLANRVLEPYMWHTVIASATEWSNFFALRNHPDAQPEIRTIAAMMQEDFESHQPTQLAAGEWHLPLLQPDEIDEAKRDQDKWAKICAARCARVSYLTHAGKRDPQADLDMFDKLTSSGHMSPLEHVGYAMSDAEYQANQWSAKFRGFVQYRKLIPGENDFSLMRARGEQQVFAEG
jgi:hypothetical protein